MKYPEPKNVKSYNQHQMQMFPPSVRSLLEDDHLCLVVDDVVKILDLSCLYQKVCPEGNPGYHPAMMLKILFYSYATGIFSSRKIAKAMCENIAFIYLGAWQQPDFRTISDFRKNNLKELKELFVQIVMLCKHMGMIKLGHVSIDGTKVKANASDAKTYDSKRFEKEIKRLLDQADAVDHHEDQQYGADQSGDGLPASIRNQHDRISTLKQLQQKLTESKKEKINTTDADAVFMKTSKGIKTSYNAQVAVDQVFMKTSKGIKTSYNAQVAVDQENQVIIATDVTNQPADVKQLIPMIDQAEQNASDCIDTCSADSGYSSGENLKILENRSVEAYIPDRDYQAQARGKKQGPFYKNEFVYDEQRDLYICPEGEELVFRHLQKLNDKESLRIYQCKSCRQCQFFGQCTTNDNGRTISRHPYEKQLKQMREKLNSDQGKAIYGLRKHIVEPVFGQIKSVIRFTSFLLRGLEKVKGEFNLVAIAHNLRKIWLHLKAGNKRNVKNRLNIRLATL